MVCIVKGCKEKVNGWIDFATYKTSKESDYYRLSFCKEHYEEIMKKIKECIEHDKSSGRLEKNHDYCVVPPHITEQVMAIPKGR